MIHQGPVSLKKCGWSRALLTERLTQREAKCTERRVWCFIFSKRTKTRDMAMKPTIHVLNEASAKLVFSAADQLFVGQRSIKPKAMEGDELLH